MADINRVELFGRFGTDVELRNLPSGRELAVFSLATDTGYVDKDQGAWSPNLQWHQCFTFQASLVGVLKERGKRGARAIVVGQLASRRWRKDGEENDRTEIEIMIGFGGSVNFVDHDRPAGKPDRNQTDAI
jgi:single-strand DNA-binding protein